MKIPKPFTLSPLDYENFDALYDYYENQDKNYEDLEETKSISEDINWNLQNITWFFNFFHLIILTRKPLRTNAIFIYMMAVAISDLINFGLCNYDFYLPYEESQVPRRIVDDEVTYYCMKFKWMPIYIEGQIRSTIFEITKRLSVWFSITMSFLRTISVMYPMSSRVQTATSVKWTLLIIFGLTVVWFMEHTWHIWRYYRYFWFPDIKDSNCPKQPKNETEVYVLVVPQSLQNWLDIYTMIPEIVLKFLPFLIYPILTVLLLYTIHSYKKKRRTSVSNEKKSDKTSGLVLFMTITFMLSEGLAGLHGIFWLIETKYFRFWGGKNKNIMAFQLPTLRTINCLSHIVVCIIMSNQYRDAIKSLFCCCKKDKPWNSAATVVRKSTSVSKTSSLATVG